jgi:uncharacterized protein (DUF1697 family)
MTTAGSHVVLLRGINVAGRSIVPMAELRDLVRALGHADVTTYIQSGNVIIRSPRGDPADLAEEIGAAVSAHTGGLVTAVHRDSHELARIVAGNPFAARGNPSACHVTFLAAPAPPDRWTEIAADAGDPDEFRSVGAEVFLFCADGYGRTRLTNAFFERRLSVAATTRNWRTVAALADLAAGLGDRDGG